MPLPTEIELVLFDTALQIEDPKARGVFLDWVFKDSPEEGEKLRKLLLAEDESRNWFHETAATRARIAAEIIESGSLKLPPSVGESIESIGLAESVAGRFQLLKRLGGGSGGVVFLARQDEPIERSVAVKLLRAGMDTPAFLAAFHREGQALALMSHPNIATIIDAGTTGTGRPYFVMELVEGDRITKFCDDARLAIPQRLGLFLQVCAAIQHAHQKGIIHRDIKPSNIIVSSKNGPPLVKVIDFGIALTNSGASGSPGGGTPAYMSPEQAESSGSDVDTRADVFGLGVLLYELLAGDLPWSPAGMPRSGAAPMPSEHLSRLDTGKLAAVAARRQTRPDRLIAALRGDLDSIVRKATSDDRQSRYETANSLIAEVRRHLSDHPVLAHPPGRLYFTRKFVRRNALAVFSGLAVMGALLLGAGGAFSAFLREREALRGAEVARANEAALRQEVQARETVAKAAILLSQNQIEAADALLRSTPLERVSPSLEAASVFRFLGERNAILGRWRQASDSFVKLMQANQLEPAHQTVSGMDPLLAAPCLLEAGDEAAFNLLRLDLLRRFPVAKDARAAEHMVKMCLLRPADPTLLRELEPMAGILRDAMERSNEQPFSHPAWNSMALALFDYRAGDYERSLVWSGTCLGYPEFRPSRIAAVRMISAMAHQRLGRPDEARREFDLAFSMIEESIPQFVVKDVNSYNPGQETWYAWAVARIFRREAAETLGLPRPDEQSGVF
jgi:hypothetical protein